MPSAWLRTELADYEAHIELTGQAAAIRAMLRAAVEERRPESLLYLGCAGGNGLQCVPGSSLQRVEAVDLNPGFLEIARRRWSRLAGVRFHAHDLNRGLPDIPPVDLAFAALVLEYIDDPVLAMRRIAAALRPGGAFVLALLRSGPDAPVVIDSPYRERLQAVGAEFRALNAEAVAAAGLDIELRRMHPLPAGKWFEELHCIPRASGAAV